LGFHLQDDETPSTTSDAQNRSSGESTNNHQSRAAGKNNENNQNNINTILRRTSEYLTMKFDVVDWKFVNTNRQILGFFSKRAYTTLY
jgi:hypothetical protein